MPLRRDWPSGARCWRRTALLLKTATLCLRTRLASIFYYAQARISFPINVNLTIED
ncbi:hypothetical protein BT69DRAFT_1275569, partial [Atractiella rhizophila]